MSSALALQHKTWAPVRARLYSPEKVAPKPPKAERPVSPFHPSRMAPQPVKEQPQFITISGVVVAHYAFADLALIKAVAGEPAWRRIAMEVAQKHGVTLHDLKSIRRDRKSVLARHEAFYRCRMETSMSLPQIARQFGGRDHTTVLHGARKHEARMAQSADISTVDCAT